MLLKLCNVVAIALAAAWFARSPGLEPALTALTLFAGWAAMEVRERSPSPHDQALFEELQRDLPAQGVIAFLRQHDFGD